MLTIWKPAVTASARLLKLADTPVLVTVTVVGVLIEFGAVVAKTIDVGANWIAAPAAPVPLSNTVAGVATEAELTVNVPDAAPTAVGRKTTPIVQFAPAARLPVQEFCVTLN